MTALRWIAGILATAAVIRATFYALGWFGGDSEALAWLMSCLVVGVTVLMPQMAVILWRNGSRGLAVVAGVLTVVVMAFSMLMTVGGIYNARNDRAILANVASGKAERDATAYADAVAQIKVLDKQLDVATREQDRLAGLLATSQDDKAQKRLDAQTKRVDTLRGDILNLQQVKREIDVSTPRADFFDWLGGLLGVGRDVVELFGAIIPAVVIDVAAPVLLFVVFFI